MADRFIVVFSGNLGRAHALGIVLDAAVRMGVMDTSARGRCLRPVLRGRWRCVDGAGCSMTYGRRCGELGIAKLGTCSDSAIKCVKSSTFPRGGGDPIRGAGERRNYSNSTCSIAESIKTPLVPRLSKHFRRTLLIYRSAFMVRQAHHERECGIEKFPIQTQAVFQVPTRATSYFVNATPH